MSELLPCPFCGGKGEHRQHAELRHSHNAGCADADCIGYIVAYDFFSGEEAIAAWNTRAQLAAPADLVRRLLADHQRVEPHHADQCQLCREAQAAIDGQPAQSNSHQIAVKQGERQPAYGCHCDLEPDMAPDGCVIDQGMPQHCIYAKSIERKEQCTYWQPIVRANACASAPGERLTEQEKARADILGGMF